LYWIIGCKEGWEDFFLGFAVITYPKPLKDAGELKIVRKICMCPPKMSFPVSGYPNINLLKFASWTIFRSLVWKMLPGSLKTENQGGQAMLNMEKDFVLVTREACDYLRISRPTYVKYLHTGRIKGTKAGKAGES